MKPAFGDLAATARDRCPLVMDVRAHGGGSKTRRCRNRSARGVGMCALRGIGIVIKLVKSAQTDPVAGASAKQPFNFGARELRDDNCPSRAGEFQMSPHSGPRLGVALAAETNQLWFDIAEGGKLAFTSWWNNQGVACMTADEIRRRSRRSNHG